jgi:hypothetical protein
MASRSVSLVSDGLDGCEGVDNLQMGGLVLTAPNWRLRYFPGLGQQPAEPSPTLVRGGPRSSWPASGQCMKQPRFHSYCCERGVAFVS